MDEQLRGMTVPLVTPFTASLAVDWRAFDAHVERMLAAGVTALLPGDLVGEGWALDTDERLALVQRTVELAGSRAIVIAKVMETSLPAAARFARAARARGAHAVKLILPSEARVTPALEEYVGATGPDSGGPFLVETDGGSLPLALIDRLAAQPEFVGIEETSLDLDRFDLLVERYGQQGKVIAGSEDALGFTLLLGAAGFMTATPNFAPAFMRALWQAGSRGDVRETLERYRRLRRYRRLFQAELRAGRPMFASYTKAALELLGHPVGSPRPPLRRLTDAERDTLREILGAEFGLELA